MSDDLSLGDAATFAGVGPRRADVSMGDERTVGGDAVIQDTVIDDIEVVDLAARYRTEGTLGQGGMGAVILATDTRLGRRVAIKRILGEAARSRTAVARFLTEAKAIAALNHPNIVQIYDYGRAQDGPFLIMEYVDGGSLADMSRSGAVPSERAIELIGQVCDGLGLAHALGIIHRDIKPANILLNKAGVPKLTDFGLAKAEAADHGMTMTGAVMGTPDFMPPEQRKDAALVDHRSDLWALAATLYQLLTGRSPKIVRLHEVPQGLQPVLAKALEDEKEDRYQSAAEFREAIRSALEKPARRPAVPGVDLAVGECPKCHEPNEATRKFCRNADCAAALRVQCLAPTCGHEIPVWDKVCPECGAKQAELVSAKAAEFAAQQAAAGDRLASHDFAAAALVAETLAKITDSRLEEFREWALAFGTRVAGEKAAADELRATRLREAVVHRDAFDYASAIHAIESLPETLRLDEHVAMLRSLRAADDESRDLLDTIRKHIDSRKLDGLLALATRALQLRGDREDLRKLVGQLQEREARRRCLAVENYEAAARLFADGDARGALGKLAPCVSLLTKDETQLVVQLRHAVQEEEKFAEMLAAAKADGKLTPEEVVGLEWQASRCLEVNSKHSRILTIHRQLRDRIKADPKSHAPYVLRLQSQMKATTASPTASKPRRPPGGGMVTCPGCGAAVKAKRLATHQANKCPAGR